jgi:hypothetical protein
MKRSIFTLLFVAFTISAWSQIITSNPVFITKDYTGVIELTYDATKGTAGLKDYVGTDGIYAHIGVITSSSTSNSDWKHAPTWGDNSEKYKLTSVGSNKWKLMIVPSMTTYFSLNSGEIVKKLAMVFRNGLKTKEGKDTGGTDIFVTVYDAGLNVAFTSPSSNQSVTVGSTVNFIVGSSLAADLELKMNNTSIKTAAAATTLTHSQTFSSTGDYTLIASASLNGTILYDTLQICVPEAVSNQARPAGLLPGINYISNTSVTLVLHAPNKSSVFLIGEFNDWSQLNAYQLKRDSEYWWITLDNLTPGKVYGFQYLVDGTIKIPDPYTEMALDPWNDKWINEYYSIYPNIKAYPSGKTEGLVATFQTAKPSTYTWEVPSFTMPSKDNMVIYELLLRDFTVEKSLNAAITKLDYLKNLGVTAIELMPIQEFEGNNSWGYNPNLYFAPDKAYGTPDMYKKFIDECHKRGMAVLLDVVFNQSTGLHPFASLFWDGVNSRPAADNPWMNAVAPHQFSVLNDFDHSYTPTREYFKRVLKYWLTEYKVDGYRLDLTKGFTQNSGTESVKDQSRIDYLTEYYNASKEVKSDIMFILEHFCAYDEELELANKGMYLWRNVNNSYSQAAMGFQSNSDFGGMNTLPRRWIGYAESHDEERNFFKAKEFGSGVIKTDSIYRISRVPLNIAFTALIPGPKMIWQFGEMGFDYSIDSNGGRTNPKPSAWGWLNLAHRKAAYDASAKIITLRKMYPTVFNEGILSMQGSASDWDSGKRIAITHNDLNVVALGNFNASTKISAFPNFPKTGSWYNLLTGQLYYVGYANTPIEVKAGEVLIFTDRQINFTNGVEKTEAENYSKVYPTATSGKVIINTPNGQNTVNVYNMQGGKIMSATNKSEINIAHLTNGMYLVEVVCNEGKNTVKILKK